MGLTTAHSMAKPREVMSPELLNQIAEAIQSIRFGSVQITIHNSRVVQIEKAEKVRFDRAHLTPGGVFEDSSRTDRTTGGSRTQNGS